MVSQLNTLLYIKGVEYIICRSSPANMLARTNFDDLPGIVVGHIHLNCMEGGRGKRGRGGGGEEEEGSQKNS